MMECLLVLTPLALHAACPWRCRVQWDRLRHLLRAGWVRLLPCLRRAISSLCATGYGEADTLGLPRGLDFWSHGQAMLNVLAVGPCFFLLVFHSWRSTKPRSVAQPNPVFRGIGFEDWLLTPFLAFSPPAEDVGGTCRLQSQHYWGTPLDHLLPKSASTSPAFVETHNESAWLFLISVLLTVIFTLHSVQPHTPYRNDLLHRMSSNRIKSHMQ